MPSFMDTALDYYKILNISREANNLDVSKAYRREALKYHPHQHKDNAQAAVQFSQAAEAYAVLSDPQIRALFDRYGEKGLKQGVPNGKGGFTMAWTFTMDPMEMFSSFFGSNTPFSEMLNDTAVPLFVGEQDSDVLPKVKDIAINLYSTLEEMYTGAIKKKKIKRNRLAMDNVTIVETTAFLSVEIKPGCKVGTKFTFSKAGNEALGMLAGDVVFTVCETPHPRFERQTNDLIHKVELTLCDALTGCIVYVETLDDRTLPIPVTKIIETGSTMVMEGEGMPLFKEPTTKGNMIIQFTVKFPESLTQSQRETLQLVLNK